MVRQATDYIPKRKKFFLIRTILWGIAIITVYLIGILITNTRAGIGTIMAAVMTLGLAQNLTRYLVFIKYSAPDLEIAKKIESIDDVEIYHSAIISSDRKDIYIPHILLKASEIFFIVYNKDTINQIDEHFYQKFIAKGIDRDKLHFIIVDNDISILEDNLQAVAIDCSPNIEIINAMLI
ncbi:MAG: hypothetical protein BEN19_04670 [Epulopiscium sp. Nuni2H_MBin003]|nr:MAG: hypothetical protein BEN19_04670 [Epulopiscium sp. Nuni2H_MBin003]